MNQDSFLYREIHEQPEAISRLLNNEEENIRQLAETIKEKEIDLVVVAARGTSDNAGLYAKYLFGSINQLSVMLATPSLYTIYKKPPRFRNTMVLGISQSGKSPDIVSVLAEGRSQGALTVALTNYQESDLANQADYVIGLHAGEERSLAATKTYTTELSAVALFSASLAGGTEMLNAVKSIPEIIANTLSINAEVPWLANRFRYMQHCAVIGRGYNYATAFELALKLKELTYTIAEPYSSADFLHGPLALVSSGFPVLVIAPSGELFSEMSEFIQTIKAREAEVVVVSDQPQAKTGADFSLIIPNGVPEWLSPLPAIIPGQLLAMNMALARNIDPDHPRGLRKVTETW